MAFWKPGTLYPGATEVVTDRETTVDTDAGSLSVYHRHLQTLSIEEQRRRLPVFKSKNAILHLLEDHRVLIIVGETGSGKTTQIPQYLHEAQWTTGGRVAACTQPRRVAATTVAARVAQEMQVKLGQEVGYAVRFEDVTSAMATRLKYMTDGMLFREMLLDPLLTKYSVIMIDEAHERSLYTDILLGVLKRVMAKRTSLRLIISSATLDAESFRDYFLSSELDAVIMSLEGRMFPVDIQYLAEACSDYVVKAAETVVEIHTREVPGDILVFLTGREEIDKAMELVRDILDKKQRTPMELILLPLYGGLALSEQMAVFEPAGRNERKCIFATNIAEASVTIDGIVFVVDSGFVKIRAYDVRTNFSTLTVVPISQASARQRAGRAGRTRPGKCFRLYTEAVFEGLRPSMVPEMQRSPLAPVVLQLKALGLENILRFDFLSPPPAAAMTQALELLYSLDAVDDYGRLKIPYGERLAELPFEPQMAAVILNSGRFGCSEEIATIAAMLSVENVFVQPAGKRNEADKEKRRFSVLEGDHLTYLNTYNAFVEHNASSQFCHAHFLNYQAMLRARAIRRQLLKYLERFSIPLVSCEEDTEPVRKCIVSGYFAQIARKRPDNTYVSLRDGTKLEVHPTSVFWRGKSPEWVVFHEVVETKSIFMRELTAIEPNWAAELAPRYWKQAR
ncbi:P-loop containing nucleoside triphosphate hydrolase protein [Hyaloraphidium curvatum]|nr:P-loop containing nucleoside triphosphate hydrolase protein [Hyaloraphidium curvatum]